MGEGDRKMKRPQRFGIAVAAGSVLIAAVGLSAGSFIKSPQQVAAEKEPPPADVLTAKVEKRVLRDSLNTRGKVSAGRIIEVAAGATGPDALKPIVTKVRVTPQSPIKAGAMLLEISGRPVFALEGPIPAYRDLKPGTHGDDVRQLQRALQRLGHGVAGDRSGLYGPGTKAAVASLYARMGYSPPLAAKDVEGDAAGAVEDARHDLGRELKKDPSGRSPSVGETRGALAEAEASLAKAQAGSGPMVPASEVVFLPRFPARVSQLQARVGEEADKKLMSVSSGALVIKGELAQREERLVRRGQRVQVTSETSGLSVTGRIETITKPLPNAEASHEDEASEEGSTMVVKPDSPLPAASIGQDVRLSIQSAASDGKVLAVPTSAVSTRADSQTTVTVVTGDDRRQVVVRTGAVGDGYAEITSVRGPLSEGDKVIVGMARAGHAS
ncbi:peptidoglycan-binding protein [Streptomyces sp. NPDC086554]|uniref:peptidoglycan-binding protein n=1 Tax=Streptomyces sp. NPDC086554 TaxID=3154864 RepID=UPI003430D3E4